MAALRRSDSAFSQTLGCEGRTGAGAKTRHPRNLKGGKV
jgi:hypothetical protein